jgi:hypothetical protein
MTVCEMLYSGIGLRNKQPPIPISRRDEERDRAQFQEPTGSLLLFHERISRGVLLIMVGQGLQLPSRT